MERKTVEIIAQHALFRRLSQQGKAQVLRVMQEEDISPNSLIFQEDSQGDSLYVVVEGTVLLQRNIDGDPVPLAQLQQGESFGELAALTPGNRLLTAKAIDSGHVVRLSNDALNQLAQNSPETAVTVKEKILDHFLMKIRHLQPVWEQVLDSGIDALGGQVLGREA